MVSLKDNRVVILEENGHWVSYPSQVGFMHRDCIEDFADKKGLRYSDVDTVVKQTKSAIFEILNESTVVGFIPDSISDDQLYQLDAFALLGLDDVKYMEIKKLDKNKTEFILDSDVADRFSTEVIQSYYNKHDDLVK